MPDVTLSYRAAIHLRRFPILHRPLRWMRRRAWPLLRRTALGLLRPLTSGWTRIGPPAGLFSVRDLIARGELEGRIILEDQGKQVLPERSLQVLARMVQHESQPWPIVWSRQPDARLISSSLALINEHKRLSIESVYRRFHVNDPAFNQVFLPRPGRLAGRWTSIVSWWSDNTKPPPFSHWLMDALPRLAVLNEFPADTGILVPRALAGYQKESLRLLGLLDRVRYTPEQHLIVEDYYFSSPTAMIACYNPYGVRWLRAAFLPRADTSYRGPRRFLIQRKGKTRGIHNEAEVSEFFRRLGWEIIDTEKLTLAQEIQLFANAEAFAGVLGSGFTNAIWSPPGCKVISFVADSWVDGWVEWICDVNKLNYHWEIFPSDDAMMAEVPVDGIKTLLRRAGLPDA